MSDDPVAAAILAAVAARGAGKSICPSEVARVLAEPGQDPAGQDWQRHLPAVRQAARGLAKAGRIAILRKGKPVDPDDFKGVIRLALKQEPR